MWAVYKSCFGFLVSSLKTATYLYNELRGRFMTEYDYEKLLKKAEAELPETIAHTDRFQIENVKGHLEGNKTVLSNFKKIAKDLGRELDHMLKFILKELATPGKVVGDRVILGAKVPASKINKKIRQYAGQYVLCPECGKPDTSILKKETGAVIRCSACGEEHPVKSL
jgi:translation initiation factor 2 subunit 2